MARLGRFGNVLKAVFETERRQSAVFSLILFVVAWALAGTYFQSWFPIHEALFQNLAALVIGTFWVERLFTPPRDALVNAFAGLALTLSLLRDPNYLPSLLIGLAIYYLLVIFCAAFASWRQQGDIPGPLGNAYHLAYAFVVSGGRATVVYSLAFLATLTPLSKAGDPYALANFLLLWIAVVSLPHLIQRLRRLFGQDVKQHIGLVTSATSPMNVEALLPKAEVVSVGDLVEIKDTCRLCVDSHPVTCYGRVINVYSDSRTAQGAQTAQIQIFGAWHNDENCKRAKNPFGLYEVADMLGIGQRVMRSLGPQGLPKEVQELAIFAEHGAAVGYVLERSTVDKMRFAVYPHRVVRRGDVVAVSLPVADLQPLSVFYQVLDVTTSDEEPTRPPYAMQYALAAQIGAVEEDGQFRTCDLTPYVRTPVCPGSGIVRDDQEESLTPLGFLPRTETPVLVDINALVVYHTAILGTTGSGKTTFLRALLPKIADRGIKVLVIDSHNEFQAVDGDNTACVLTLCSPCIPDALDLFLRSEELKELLEKMGSKPDDLDKAREEVKGYTERALFSKITDMVTKRESLGTSGKDKAVKRILDEFAQNWYPRVHLVKQNEESTGTDCCSILSQWYAGDGIWNKSILIVKLHNLSIDEQRWIMGLIAARLFNLASDEGLTSFLEPTGDPQARVCIVIEEAHTFAPETGFSIGEDKNPQRFCASELRNLMLHARKYGIGTIVASQRSAFIDKGVLSQCNTLFAMKTMSVNDKKVFNDFMDSDWVQLVTYLGTPPKLPQAILVGKAAVSSIPLIIQYKTSFLSNKRLEREQ